MHAPRVTILSACKTAGCAPGAWGGRPRGDGRAGRTATGRRRHPMGGRVPRSRGWRDHLVTVRSCACDIRRMGVFCTIVPPHILDKLASTDDPDLSGAARATLEHDARHRTRRRAHAVAAVPAPATAPTPADHPVRTIYDAEHREDLPGRKVLTEGGTQSKDVSVVRAYAARRDLRDLPQGVRPALRRRARAADERQRALPSGYNNAFWDGHQMVFGDGDGKIFLDFTLPARRDRARTHPRRHRSTPPTSTTTGSPAP